MGMDAQTRRRLEVLETHFASEVEHDWDQCLATFKGIPRYEIVPMGHIHEGAEAVRAYHQAQRQAFPDQRHEHVRMHVGNDDTIVAEFDLIGTNTGPFMESGPTGKAFRVPVVAVFSFDGDGISNERVCLDVASLVRQIGRTDLFTRRVRWRTKGDRFIFLSGFGKQYPQPGIVNPPIHVDGRIYRERWRNSARPAVSALGEDIWRLRCLL